MSDLAAAYPNIGEAYRLKELFREVLNSAQRNREVTPLEDWITQAWSSSIVPIKKFVNTLHDHSYGVETYFHKLSSNAFAEKENLKIQGIRRLTKGLPKPV